MLDNRAIKRLFTCAILAAVVTARAAVPAPDSERSALDEAAKSMFEQTNTVRSNAGLPPLKWNGLLVETSSHMAVDLKDRNDLSHTDSKGRSFKQRMRSSRYMPYVKVGENLASGFVKPEDALKALMKSSGHRKNILNPEFVELGISVEEHFVYGRVWVQHFGRKS